MVQADDARQRQDSAVECWVLHRGALGDCILLWPLLRAKVASGMRVVLVTDRSKGLLAAEVLGIDWRDIEQPAFNTLWLEDPLVEPVPAAREVIIFAGSGKDAGNAADAAEERWLGNLQRLFPAARLNVHRSRPDSIFAREWTAALDPPQPEATVNVDGPVVCHIGAGGSSKRWPLERFVELAAHLERATGRSVLLFAGEVEAERFTEGQQAMFAAAGGQFILELSALAGIVRSASLFIGNDSGPAHLAAQLGIRALAIFGPTDPEQWGPVGPQVEILSPSVPSSMDWLSLHDVIKRLEQCGWASALPVRVQPTGKLP